MRRFRDGRKARARQNPSAAAFTNQLFDIDPSPELAAELTKVGLQLGQGLRVEQRLGVPSLGFE